MADRMYLGPNEHLIGLAGSRQRMATPALIIDVDTLQQNITGLAATFAAGGLSLRPHAKTHKSAIIAQRQIAAGALGVCCATLREAEAIADQGVRGVLITSPVVGAEKISRLVALNDRADGLMAVCDNQANAEDLAVEMTRTQKPLGLIVDIDVGMQRTGIADIDAAVALAQFIDAAPGLAFRGLQGYSGRVQHIEAYAERADAYETQMNFLASAVDRLHREGLAPEIVTGGGTGTHAIDAARGLLTEHQAGSYIFMDVEYNAVELVAGAAPPFETALFVQCSVVSNNHDGFVTIDGGFKCFATDGPKPEVADAALPGASYHRFGDEHGKINLGDGTPKPALGSPVTLVTPHCDPTVNLHGYFHCVRGDVLEGIWPIDGRGVL